MLLEKFSSIIDRSAIGKAVGYREELIKQTDPDRIYVENIRSFFHIPFKMAEWLCQAAVKEGAFEKRVGFLCPNDQSLIDDVSDGEKPPSELTCKSCEIMGEEKHQFSPSECRQITFYKLIKNG